MKDDRERGKGSELRERVFEFASAVLELHRLIYRRTLNGSRRIAPLVNEATEIVAILTTIVKNTRERTR